jgi:hypothetical protein
VAVDRVQSEPLSVQFPLTGNKTEKFSAFVPNSPQANPLSHWICEAYGSVVRFGPSGNRELIDRLSGNDHSLMGAICQIPGDRCSFRPSSFHN